jgi:hypothetical protein
MKRVFSGKVSGAPVPYIVIQLQECDQKMLRSSSGLADSCLVLIEPWGREPIITQLINTPAAK